MKLQFQAIVILFPQLHKAVAVGGNTEIPQIYKMSFSINRIVQLEDLLKRPRVSHKISEYVLSFINNEILKPSNILQSDKYEYEFTLSFDFGIPRPNKILYKSSFATNKKLFVPQKGFRIFDKITKNAHLTVIADDINSEISPADYAVVVYTMFADYLIYNYKKLKKDLFDEKKQYLDFEKINSFQYPAPFEQQKYILDDSTYTTVTDSLLQKRTEKSVCVKEQYMKHFNF